MNILWIFLKKELIQIKRDRRILPILLVAPIAQLLILGYAATFDVKKIPTIICDLDKSSRSRDLIEKFLNTGYFNMVSYSDNLKDIDTLLDGNIARVGIIIPNGFAKKVERKDNAEIAVIADGADGITSAVSLSYSNLIITQYSSIIQAGSTMKGSGVPLLVPELRIWYNQDLKSAYFMVPGIFALLLLIVSMVVSSMSLVKEKELGTIEQLSVTPIRTYQIILGKMSPFVIISFVDVIIVTLIATLWFKVPLRGSLVDLFIAVMLFLLSALGLGLLISINVSTQQQAMMSAIFLVVFPSMLLSGFIFPIENMPQWIQPISRMLPMTYFLNIIRGIFLRGATFSDLMVNYAALTLIGLIIFLFSILKFKKSLE